jgi:hypothetical protein
MSFHHWLHTIVSKLRIRFGSVILNKIIHMLKCSRLEFNKCEANLRSVLAKSEQSFDIAGNISDLDSIGSVF